MEASTSGMRRTVCAAGILLPRNLLNHLVAHQRGYRHLGISVSLCLCPLLPVLLAQAHGPHGVTQFSFTMIMLHSFFPAQRFSSLVSACLLVLSLSLGCQQASNSASSSEGTTSMAQEVVNQAIEAHGGEAYEHAEIRFRFRDRMYHYRRQGGRFRYERHFTSPGTPDEQVMDVLTNEGFTRRVNGSEVAVVDSMASKYANALNSVIYFALLPYGLNDAAVNKRYLGTTHLKGIPYHKVFVSFEQEGGGEDFEDTFMYWFRTDTYHMAYLAYRFHTEGGGVRFREAYEAREVSGIRFAHYVNYKMDPELPLEWADSLFEAGALDQLSLIETEEVSVSILPRSSNE